MTDRQMTDSSFLDPIKKYFISEQFLAQLKFALGDVRVQYSSWSILFSDYRS